MIAHMRTVVTTAEPGECALPRSVSNSVLPVKCQLGQVSFSFRVQSVGRHDCYD